MYRSLLIVGALMSMSVSAADMSGWSDKTICRLAKEHGKAEYIDEAKSRGLGCATPKKELTSKSSAPKVASPLSATAYENRDDDFVYPPFPEGAGEGHFWFAHDWSHEDLNGDGLKDFVQFGTAKRAKDNIFGMWMDKCRQGYPLRCIWATPQTFIARKLDSGLVMYKRQEESLFIDNRKAPGIVEIGQVETADFNDDGKPDYYVGDTGFYGEQGVNGVRDSYYLSQPDGTWLESSETHLSVKEFPSFTHAVTAGDIDADGDMDVVFQGKNDGKDPWYCWVNQGDGHMKLNRCGRGVNPWVGGAAYDLADIDGDGDLDLINSGFNDGNMIKVSSVVLNNGRGEFKQIRKLPKPEDPHFSSSVEARGWDLDNDGDQDIILSLIGFSSAGAAIQILENINGRGTKWKSHFFSLAKHRSKEELELFYCPSCYRGGEGGFLNHDIVSIYFKDIDSDGYDDVIPFVSAYSKNNHGYPLIARSRFKTIVKNGELSFQHLLKDESGIVSTETFQFHK